MSLTGSELIKGNICVERICEIYHELRNLENQIDPLTNTKLGGVPDGYNNAGAKAFKLIKNARRYNLDALPKFKTCINNLKEGYRIS